jgi:hypothetical protein
VLAWLSITGAHVAIIKDECGKSPIDKFLPILRLTEFLDVAPPTSHHNNGKRTFSLGEREIRSDFCPTAIKFDFLDRHFSSKFSLTTGTGFGTVLGGGCKG